MRSSQIASRRLEELIEHENIHVSKHPSSLVTYGLLRKAFQIHKSVLILCREGLGSEAYALSRILIEIFIALRWITNDDQDNRAKEYGFFVAKRKEYWAKIGTKYYAAGAAWKSEIARQQKIFDKYAKRYKYFYFWSNLAEKLKGMAREKESLESSPPAPPDALWDYEVPYSMASDHVHATSMAVDELLPEVGKPFRLSVLTNDSLIANAAFTSTAWLFKIAFRVDSFRKLDLASQIDRIFRPHGNRAKSSVATSRS